MSAQEKRAEQLKALGIQENDIGTDVIEKKKGAPGRRLFHFTNPFEMFICLSIKKAQHGIIIINKLPKIIF